MAQVVDRGSEVAEPGRSQRWLENLPLEIAVIAQSSALTREDEPGRAALTSAVGDAAAARERQAEPVDHPLLQRHMRLPAPFRVGLDLFPVGGVGDCDIQVRQIDPVCVQRGELAPPQARCGAMGDPAFESLPRSTSEPPPGISA